MYMLIQLIMKNLKSIIYLCKSSIEYIEIPDGIGQIQTGAFSECSSLRSIVIPSSVYCIGKYAFEECYKLESVIMKCDHLTIGTEAFASCTNLRKVVMFDSIDIENFAFKKCYNIKSFIRIRNGKPQGTVEKYGCPINCKETFVETKSISEDFWNNI